jgi:hypothetical protein
MSNRPSEPSTRHYAVFTPGFSGSKWLAVALSRPEEGLFAFHEPIKNLVAPTLRLLPAFSDANVPLDRTELLQALAPYVAWVNRRKREVQVFGEIHTLPVFYWTTVKDLLPEARLMLVRHGVQTVHAMTSDVMYKPFADAKQWAQRGLPAQYHALPEYERVFASICHTWASLPSIASELAPGRVARLEDLTTSAAALQDAYTHLTGRPMDEHWSSTMRAQVIHKKTRGDNSPANLFWNVWSPQMREIFLALCGEALTFFGYLLPAQADAPPPDLRPREPTYAGPLPLGPLTNLWAFSSSPNPRPVVIIGQPRYALAAAKLLGVERSILFDDGRWESGRPEKFKFCTRSELAAFRDVCVYLADTSPAPDAIDRIRALQPQVEIVVMQPGTLSDDDLLTLENSTAFGRQHSPPVGRDQAIAIAPSECVVPSFGPFRVGDQLAGWKLERLSLSADKLVLHLERAPDGTLDFELCVARSEHHSPFQVGDGALYYRSTPLAFSSLTAPARAIVQRVKESLGERPLATAFTEWRR